MSGESGADSTVFCAEKCSAVVVDVAGTTTSIGFIKDELFAYVKEHVEEFLKSEWENENVKGAIKKLKDDELDVAKATELVKTLTDEQSSNEGLKDLQGLIYKKGYESGTLKGHVFADVAECFENWSKTKKVAVYSTGSVESQKLLFANTSAGDLTKFIEQYFDQSAGSKTEADSYKNIAKKLDVDAEAVVFITDNVEEANAAKTGGLVALLIKREGNPTIPEDSAKDLTVISSFKELIFDKSAKRKMPEVPQTEAPPSKIAKTNGEELAVKEVKKTDAEPKAEDAMEVDGGKEVNKETVEETEATKTEEKTEPEPTIASEEKMETEVEKVDGEKKTEEIKEPKKVEEEKEEKIEAEKEVVAEEKETIKKVEEVATETNGDGVPEEKPVNGEAAAEETVQNGEVATEKENKSVLANGAQDEKTEELNENGVEENKAAGETEAVSEEKVEENEMKVKKIEEATDTSSKTVSVEV